MTSAAATRRIDEIVVGVPTYRRPDDVIGCLRAIVPQLAEVPAANCRIVVVDNDPAAGARDAVATLAEPSVTYVNERAPGISAARNRAMGEAAGAQAIVFLDDDEVPQPGWLAALVGQWREWQCAAVTGPVESIFEEPPEDWVLASGVFDLLKFPTGVLRPGAATNNLLLDLEVLRRHQLQFDARFGLSGGSDSMLTRRLVAEGEQIRWCQEAVVSERVPATRTTREWVVARRSRTGNTWSRVQLALCGTARQRLAKRLELMMRGGFTVSRGAAQRGIAGIVRSPSLDGRGAIDIAGGLGLINGAVGRVRYEYRR